jgi:iron complex transport system permease protein
MTTERRSAADKRNSQGTSSDQDRGPDGPAMESLLELSSAHRSRRAASLFALRMVLLGALVSVSLWRLLYGDMDISASEIAALLSPLISPESAVSPEAIVVRSVRLPRLLSALGAGASLAVAGVVLQGLLLNPLAEPYTLGIASGAAFGGALVFSVNFFAVVPAALMGALFTMAAVYALAERAGGGRMQIVLAGVIVSAFLSAGVTFLKAVADERIGAIVLWLMGGFSGASPLSAAAVWLAAALSFCASWLCGRHLDAVSLGEDVGASLGIDERKLRLTLLSAVSLSSAVTVSFFGIIGFVGLVVPHLMRMLTGATHRSLLSCSFLGGAVLLASADGVAQAYRELPVGVITALVGAPFFCWLLVRGRMSNF